MNSQGLTCGSCERFACSFLNITHGWVAGTFGTVWKTEDGGETWREAETNFGTTGIALQAIKVQSHPLKETLLVVIWVLWRKGAFLVYFFCILTRKLDP